MVWSLEPLQISSGQVPNSRILFLKSSKAGGLNFSAGGPYGPVQIRDIREFWLYGRPRLTASIPDIVRPDAYSDVGTVVVNTGQHRNGNAPVETCQRTGILQSAIKGKHDTDRTIPVCGRPSSGFTPVQCQLCFL